MSFFITGTDTNVGKTYVTALIVRTLREEGLRAVGFKPVSSGDRLDGKILASASGDLPLDLVNPLHFQTALAPHVAALLENKSINPENLIAAYHDLATVNDCVLVEGAGGWEVPLKSDYFVSDLAKHLDLPVIIVAHNRLGALNHILLTISAIQTKGLKCAGIILNQIEDEMDTPMITNKGILETLTNVPLLDHIIHGQDFLSDKFVSLLKESKNKR